MRIGNRNMVILFMVKHCAIPELPSPDTTALSHLHGWTDNRADGMKCMKQVGSGLVAKVLKKKEKKERKRQANYEKRLHFFEDVSILLWHIYHYDS